MSETSNTPLPTDRSNSSWRIPKACQECRKRKIRCSGLNPMVLTVFPQVAKHANSVIRPVSIGILYDIGARNMNIKRLDSMINPVKLLQF
ncbi:C6 zinc finger domain protein [Penicillium taxi]|uniref:C6 zinc finger domain protein n=1 Tax=Penicillium taxi TaxID=168475 RepID=UPI002544F88E|nr:C6 zinc finger domain protein [Penicillium taxi]KAJ5885510.1 C6 zinc finger domain protein [Penicillium taxi]